MIIKCYFSYFSTKTYVVTPHQNRLDETVLMMGHKICSRGEIWIIIHKLSLLPILIWSTVKYTLSKTLPSRGVTSNNNNKIIIDFIYRG